MEPAKGKLGVMCVGLGAVTTTFMTGVLMARKGLAKPIGSMTQYDKIRVGRGKDKQYLHYGEIVPLTQLDDIVFGAWDVYPANAYESALNAEVLRDRDIEPVRDELKAIVPMKAAFDHNYAKRLDGDNVKDCATRWDMVEALRQDIRQFKAEKGVDRVVVIWAASTEIYVPIDEQVHGTLSALEAAMKADDREHIAPSMCYAYAALKEGAPFIMGAPNTTVDIPAMWELAEQTKMPIAGKDFKTGQTLVKSGFAPIIGTRCLGLSVGSQPTFLATATALCSTNLPTSTPRRCRSFRRSRAYSRPTSSPTFTATITTRCASTIIRPATITKRVGTTSTSLAGWATPCKSRLTSFAATLFWPLRCCLTLCCSPTSLPARAAMARSAS